MTKPTQRKKTQPKGAKSVQLLRIRERDCDILRLVYEHRFLDTELLWYLIRGQEEEPEYTVGADGKRRPRTYGFGRKALYKRLRQLTDAKYLKGRQSLPQRIGRGFGGARIAYGLGPKSAVVLSESGGVSQAAVKDIVAANQVGAPFIQHALEIARFRVILELACQQSGGRVRLIFWEQGQCLQDWVSGDNEEGEEQRFSVFPDAFFAIEVSGKGKAHYFLELDRGTMPIVASGNRSDIRKKLHGYSHYRKQKLHSARYQYSALPDGRVVGLQIREAGDRVVPITQSTAEPIKSFRVLFVAPGATAGVLSARGRIANILSALPALGKHISTSTLFWFASLDTFDLEHPETILGSVWFTPNPTHGLKSLVG